MTIPIPTITAAPHTSALDPPSAAGTTGPARRPVRAVVLTVLVALVAIALAVTVWAVPVTGWPLAIFLSTVGLALQIHTSRRT